MKKLASLGLMVVMCFIFSLVSFAEVNLSDIKEIDMKGVNFEGVSGNLMIYSTTIKGSSSFSSTVIKYGVRNINGDVDSGAVFDGINSFSEGLAAIYQYDEWGNIKVGFIDQSGKIVIKPKYDSAEMYPSLRFNASLGTQTPKFVSDRALVKSNGKLVYINKKGSIVFSVPYLNAYSFSDGRAKVEMNIAGKYGYRTVVGFIDVNGKTVVKPQYESANDYKSGLALVMNFNYDNKSSQIGFIDKNGKLVIKLTSNQITMRSQYFENGLFLVRRTDGKYGYMDVKGKMAIDYKFSDADPFSNGLAKVSMMKDGVLSSGYINTKGDVVIKPGDYVFNSNDNFDDGYISFYPVDSLIWVNYGLMDKKGNVIFQPILNDVPLKIEGGLIVQYYDGEKTLENFKIGFVSLK